MTDTTESVKNASPDTDNAPPLQGLEGAPRRDSADPLPSVLGLLFVLVPLYYFFVWKRLPSENYANWVVTGLILLGALLLYVFYRAKTMRFYKIVSMVTIVVAIIGGAAFASILFTVEDQVQLFKLFVIVYFSLLPPWLYLQFITTKGKTLWEEYVLNLYRLRIDEPSNLPMPPMRSPYFAIWNQSVSVSLKEAETLYEKKFVGLFGPVRSSARSAFAVFQGENLWPVAMATLIVSLGWVLVVQPSTVFNIRVLSDTPGSAIAPQIPLDALRFAFLGAYFYILQMLVRRYFQNDLKTSAYVNATMRVIVVILLVWTLDLVAGEWTGKHKMAAAFVIGVFPYVGWQAIQGAVKWPLKVVVPSLRQQYPLSDLDGLNIWYESRLLEEGIEDMQNLATANLVDVMLNTRIPIERLVDWIDQAFLCLHLAKGKGEGNDTQREKLRQFGIRTATDLESIAATANTDKLDRLEKLLKEKTAMEAIDVPSLALTLSRQPNLEHVRNWKLHSTTRN